jgi:hypothetical protein
VLRFSYWHRATQHGDIQRAIALFGWFYCAAHPPLGGLMLRQFQLSLFREEPTVLDAPLCVSYGMGVDSTAMLIGLWRRGIMPTLITFADTGGEKPETYAYLPVINAWLQSVGFPEVTVVKYAGKHGRYDTLEGNCLANKTLPSLAFGGKSCSQKFKTAPQNALRRQHPDLQIAWKAKIRPLVAVGYDCGPADSRRSNIKDDKWFRYWYPLREWGWDRDECKRQIRMAGLGVPPKSACFYCPATKPDELTALVHEHPDLAARIVAMESAAAATMRTADNGLWREGCKGTRGSIARPGRMTHWINAILKGEKWQP